MYDLGKNRITYAYTFVWFGDKSYYHFLPIIKKKKRKKNLRKRIISLSLPILLYFHNVYTYVRYGEKYPAIIFSPDQNPRIEP